MCAENSASSDRNWLGFLSVIDGTFADLTVEDADVEAAKATTAGRIMETREFLAKVVEADEVKDRSGHLALLELEKRSRQHGLATGILNLTHL